MTDTSAPNYLCGGDVNVPAFFTFTVPSICTGRSVTDTGGCHYRNVIPTARGPHCHAVSGRSAVVLVIRTAFAALNYLCGGDENVPAFCAFTVPAISTGRSVTDTGDATTGTSCRRPGAVSSVGGERLCCPRPLEVVRCPLKA
ncbi:hypothetical protein E2C01_089155 [Portunus trituberculatus]|uniref:Uncharacterized protein n=1 Tax=Portunus trituberculatus TaxID=210409 RepID=A0A5B7JHD9_PORTR|nr:hypothetical protein [Portunus trituberculatus]